MPNDSLLFMLELIYYASLITKVKQRNSVSKVRQRQCMRVVSGWDICSRPGRVPDGGGLRGQGGLETGCGNMVWSSLVYAALHVIQCRIVDPASDGQLLGRLE